MRGLRSGERDPELPTSDQDSGDRSVPDLQVDQLLRAIAHAPPRRPASSVVQDTRWGDAGRYLIKERLGRGGMGTVYSAIDTVLNRPVALKVLDAADREPAQHARLLREARLAAQVEHQRIARVYDVGSHEGLAFVAMEKVSGCTLRQWISGRSLTATQVVDIATQIAEGLAQLHANGVVHRDLKPENVMFNEPAGIKVLDFGLARHTITQAEPPHEATAAPRCEGASVPAASGTPGYMAPEQCLGQPIDARVDVFALGVIIYELVTGRRLFRGASAEATMRATLAGAPPLRDGRWLAMPAALSEHTTRMLAVEPSARFADGASALAALRALATVSSVTAAATGSPAGTDAIAGWGMRPAGSGAEGQRGSIAGRGMRPAGSGAEGQRGSIEYAVGSAFCQAPTQLALPAVRPRARGAAAKQLVRWLAAAAALVVAIWAVSPRPAPVSAPAGMVRVDEGVVQVGHSQAEIDRECRALGAGCDPKQLQREVPGKRVAVPAFFLDRDEVTTEQFVAFLNNFFGQLVVGKDEDAHAGEPVLRWVRRNHGTGNRELLAEVNQRLGGIDYPDVNGVFRVRPGFEKRPVALVSWHAARWFCEAIGKRLPSEDEWEAAARGRGNRRFPWGDVDPSCTGVAIPNDGKLRVSGSCSRGEEVPLQAVGAAAQDVTPRGVRGLGGNVAEWTSSWFVEEGRAANATNLGPEAQRVVKGGSFGLSLLARSSGRTRRSASVMAPNIGFRCALSVDVERSKEE